MGNALRLALVMSGGGARAAYQVGFLHSLAERRPDLQFEILTGVSAGAINTAFLAAHAGSFPAAVADLVKVWQGIDVDDVFRAGALALWSNAARVGLSLVGGGVSKPRRGMVDTSPLRTTLARAFGSPDERRLPGIAGNLQSGRLAAVAITAASYTTGRSVTFVQGQKIHAWERDLRQSREVVLRLDHVMASAALPFLFPAIEVDGAWYGDGGMRLTAPFSPAIHLGAEQILAISTRRMPTEAEAEEPKITGYPSFARVAGLVLNSIFLDQFDGDALRLERINELLRALPPEKRGELREVKLLVMRPSRDLGRLADDYEPRLPRALRFLTRGLGTKHVRQNDLLSLIMFQADYLQRLIDLGRSDGERRRAEVDAFLAEGGY